MPLLTSHGEGQGFVYPPFNSRFLPILPVLVARSCPVQARRLAAEAYNNGPPTRRTDNSVYDLEYYRAVKQIPWSSEAHEEAPGGESAVWDTASIRDSPRGDRDGTGPLRVPACPPPQRGQH